jgi:hypothetical protein
MMIGVAQVIGMKPTLQLLLLDRTALREDLGRRREREKLGDRGKRGRGTDRLQKSAAGGVVREHGAHSAWLL